MVYKIFSKNDRVLIARKKWHNYIVHDYVYFWDVYSQMINYCALIDLEIVKLQDIYAIVYFINPEGIGSILENNETNSLVNYIYQRFLKVKDWVTTRHNSYCSWIIYSWKEISLHFLSFNSSSDPKSVIVGRWVKKYVP